jgi:hypothetical protein
MRCSPARPDSCVSARWFTSRWVTARRALWSQVLEEARGASRTRNGLARKLVAVWVTARAQVARAPRLGTGSAGARARRTGSQRDLAGGNRLRRVGNRTDQEACCWRAAVRSQVLTREGVASARPGAEGLGTGGPPASGLRIGAESSPSTPGGAAQGTRPRSPDCHQQQASWPVRFRSAISRAPSVESPCRSAELTGAAPPYPDLRPPIPAGSQRCLRGAPARPPSGRDQWTRRVDGSGRISRVLSSPRGGATLSLGPHLRAASNGLPGGEWRGSSPAPPYSAFLRVGFTVPDLSPGPRCALTAPFHPYRRSGERRRFAFCGTFPGLAAGGH